MVGNDGNEASGGRLEDGRSANRGGAARSAARQRWRGAEPPSLACVSSIVSPVGLALGLEVVGGSAVCVCVCARSAHARSAHLRIRGQRGVRSTGCTTARARVCVMGCGAAPPVDLRRTRPDVSRARWSTGAWSEGPWSEGPWSPINRCRPTRHLEVARAREDDAALGAPAGHARIAQLERVPPSPVYGVKIAERPIFWLAGWLAVAGCQTDHC